MLDSGHQLDGPHIVVTADGSLHGEDTDENRDIARRIHACVNACDGISTEELESGVIRDMRKMIAELVPVLQSRSRQPLATSPPRRVTVTNNSPR